MLLLAKIKLYLPNAKKSIGKPANTFSKAFAALNFL